MNSLGLWICYHQMCTTSYVKNSAVYDLFPGQNLYGPHYKDGMKSCIINPMNDSRTKIGITLFWAWLKA